MKCCVYELFTCYPCLRQISSHVMPSPFVLIWRGRISHRLVNGVSVLPLSFSLFKTIFNASYVLFLAPKFTANMYIILIRYKRASKALVKWLALFDSRLHGPVACMQRCSDISEVKTDTLPDNGILSFTVHMVTLLLWPQSKQKIKATEVQVKPAQHTVLSPPTPYHSSPHC